MLSTSDDHLVAIQNKEHIMHLIFSPILADGIWIGGSALGLMIVIVLVVLVLRR